MSTIDLRGHASLEDLVAAIEQLGGAVSWQDIRPAGTAAVALDFTADAEDAYEALPARYFEPDDLPFDPDPTDVKDFVAACLSGERHLACDLLPRVVGSLSCQEYGERALRSVGGRA